MKLHDTIKNADGLYRSLSDKPLSQLKRESVEAGKAMHVPYDVMPKFTCGRCGERNFAGAPNEWPEEVTCNYCGHTQPFLRGGYAMRYRFNETPENRHLPPKVLIGLPDDMNDKANAKAVADAFGMELEDVQPASRDEIATAINAAQMAMNEAKAKAEAKGGKSDVPRV